VLRNLPPIDFGCQSLAARLWLTLADWLFVRR
jgi:hypothetical protein